MTNQEIFDLMARFDASGITTFKLDTKELTLELSKGSAAPLRKGGRQREKGGYRLPHGGHEDDERGPCPL